ncbi:bifunctional proline dehydrogenase/L-glutamate gamma-semialdehyde dehydrogenase PutA [Alphaproteobacteria bacterium GH1-50]|uniref:Bifunctional protein PutA n=1 Tax=Kangsaoukella pontilimi TaxID=2691042 RepID=A0A7C9MDT0_9RHOB|nr:bifunctional proline dehydrogenase/L-glutamate gamma-semialdehyde dehydrogenase PutA [Kangsaoukella pontilimi]MXQ07872.1 bifunctional proline dehydrogenase/L-glutamate gamma-semialdehyde dehydrogenase PutA [Kangsaoukella pontilimi]
MEKIARTPFDKYPDEAALIDDLTRVAALDEVARARIAAAGADLVRGIRQTGKPGLMEVFLAEYGLSTEEGVALMCLAEALLRVPDAETIDTLIEDKIAPSDWGKHLGHSSSSLVNASTWALMLTGRVLDERQEPGITGVLRSAVKRLGEPVIRTAARQAMREMGQQFVLGQTMKDAIDRAKRQEARGYTYSYDMLGEAARTAEDAERYFRAYADAIDRIGAHATGDDMRARPGISVKLSALFPRYEESQRHRATDALTERLRELCQAAAKAGIALNVDAEEADRLELSLDIIERVLPDPALAGWDGFGVVVQAYGLRAAPVLDHLYRLAEQADRRIMVRLVKGAYWDTEIKLAQVAGMARFPVFTSKAATDISYLACARKLLGMTDRIYPQFATHNAHTTAAVIEMSDDRDAFEFQRLHGMGERLHDILMERHGTRCRIYAPVGAHRDLLAYLVRRLLENGANSSFVNQVVDEDVPPEVVAADPFSAPRAHPVRAGTELFQPARRNSEGWDLTDRRTLARFDEARAPWKTHQWHAGPLLPGAPTPAGPAEPVTNPARPDDIVGHVRTATEAEVETALAAAGPWDAPVDMRAEVLNRAADLYEKNAGQFFALAAREAGKTPLDAVGELREAVDFLRYYASLAGDLDGNPLGTVACISPWNFPLAIFTGQIAGALAAGNAVLAKPAEQTPLIAHLASCLLLEAGVPDTALAFLPGDGATVGRAITSDARVNGVAFTGSTETARLIQRAMADHLTPGAPLVAETGGLNAMIVDSTALLEQAVRDVVASAFQSAGQRCSALRCLYVQEDIAPAFRRMLDGAIAELSLGDPWDISTDIGPLIDAEAQGNISDYVTKHPAAQAVPAPETGLFHGPTVIPVQGIAALGREVFGPVLHIATFKADHLNDVISAINETGYGLTFGLHTRIDSRVQEIVEAVHAGNIYVNRNQIGAVVGSQPFGGEGLSGTGPKAGGPWYPRRFQSGGSAPVEAVRDMPGPTGETNRLTLHPRAPLLCLGPGEDRAREQADAVRAIGGTPRIATEIAPEALRDAPDIGGALWWGRAESARDLAQALARRDGPLVPLITEAPRAFEVLHERHLCVDTTASGGNADLLAEVARDTAA